MCLCALWCVTVSVSLWCIYFLLHQKATSLHVTGNPRIVSNSRIGNPRCKWKLNIKEVFDQSECVICRLVVYMVKFRFPSSCR